MVKSVTTIPAVPVCFMMSNQLYTVIASIYRFHIPVIICKSPQASPKIGANWTDVVRNHWTVYTTLFGCSSTPAASGPSITSTVQSLSARVYQAQNP